ncbi:MAG: nucleoside deaminase [Bacilli bacterium]|nr:nucleoside deaminase [Bacilli bacterium]MBN2697012.1 nucleoside deaminase [Bacilli bacterium]
MKPSSIELMQLAIDKARETMRADIGGPFGALIIDKEGKIVAVSSNSVLRDHDPTAHAEINVIRAAGKAIGSHDLSGCTLFTTAYPCPMCLGAIIWSNIKKVVYGCQKEDTEGIGFRDDFIYDFINNGMQDLNVLELEEKHRDACLELFKEYKEQEKQLY